MAKQRIVLAENNIRKIVNNCVSQVLKEQKENILEKRIRNIVRSVLMETATSKSDTAARYQAQHDIYHEFNPNGHLPGEFAKGSIGSFRDNDATDYKKTFARDRLMFDAFNDGDMWDDDYDWDY